jgi:agmatine deiminase
MAERGSQTPSELGFRMPAEWHPHHATWLTWPKDPETWPDRVTHVEEIYLKMIAALTPHEIVNLLVDDDETEQIVRGRCSDAAASRIHFHHIQTVDSWIRDYGPNFLIGPDNAGAFNDWIFNAWGNKYEALKKDDSVPQRLDPYLKMKRFSPGIVMEGGSI